MSGDRALSEQSRGRRRRAATAVIKSQIKEIITSGGHKAKKALFEAPIEDIQIQGPMTA